MESKLELVVTLSNELDEKIFRRMVSKIRDKNLLSIDFSANRIYINLEGKRDFSDLIFEMVEKMKIYLRDYKIGVRDFYVLNYEITIPANFVGKLDLPIARTIVGNGKICRIIFKNLEKEFLRRGIVKKMITLIREKTKPKKEKIIFDNKLKSKPKKNLKDKIKKGIVKNKNFYLLEAGVEISKLRDEIISKLKDRFGCKEIFVPNELPLNLIEEENISDLIPREAFSYFQSIPKKKDLVYEVSYLTGKIPRVETKNKAILFNEIPFTLYKALENTNQKGVFYYLNELKLNLTFFEDSSYENMKQEIIEFFKEILNSKEVRYRITEKKFDLRGRNVEYYKFEVKSEKWEKVADILFAEDLYPSIFKIRSKSGHVTIDLDKLFLVG